MRILDVLIANRSMAKAAARARDERHYNEARKKASMVKGAGWREAMEFLGKGLKKIVAPFQKSPLEQEAELLRKEVLKTLQALRGQVPQDVNQFTQWATAPTVNVVREIQQTPVVKKIPTSGTIQKTKEIWHIDPQTGKEVLKAKEVITEPAFEEKVELVERLVERAERGEPKAVQFLKDWARIAPAISPKGPGGSTKALALAGLGLGASYAGLSKIWQLHQHDRNLDLILKDPMIPTSHKMRARDAFGILARYAPSIANDPVFSKDFVRTLVRYDAIDHRVISDLIQAEKHYLETKGKRSQFLNAIQGMSIGALMGQGG